MAKAEVVHSGDAVTVIFKGNPKRPEPSTGAIKFPGGVIEVSRTSDGSYWVHVSVIDPINTKESRIDYALEAHREHGIIDVPDANQIQHIALRIYPTVKEITGE